MGGREEEQLKRNGNARQGLLEVLQGYLCILFWSSDKVLYIFL